MPTRAEAAALQARLVRPSREDPPSQEVLLSLLQAYYPLAHSELLAGRQDENGIAKTKKRPSAEEHRTVTGDALSVHEAKKKQRKPSHVAKREEKQLLLQEVQRLEACAALLRQEAGVPDPQEVEETERHAAANRQLEQAIETQQSALISAHSALSEFSTLHARNPLESFIHLGKDFADRRSAVCALKDGHLQRAHRWLKQRTQLMARPPRSCHEESAYVTEEGHYVATVLDVHHFAGVQSVKQVFDALQFFFLNMEITKTELGDHLTLREDTNDLEEHPMLHHRLVTMFASGPVVEKNAIKFFQYNENVNGCNDSDEDGPYAIMAAAPVNQDDLYPFCPAERIRKDMWAAMKLSSFKRPKEPHTGDKVEKELVVVLTRWFHVQLHRSELPYPPHVLQQVQKDAAGITDYMVTSMNQTLYGAAPTL